MHVSLDTRPPRRGAVRTNAVVCALAALAVGFSGLAFAQPRDGRDDHRGPDHGNDHRAPDHGPNRGPGPLPHTVDARGAGPDHNFRRGGRLPPEYRNRQYVVDDWRGHRLSAPPRGYHWVQTGGDYVLAAIATGIIAQILLDH
jgi:Ni/Co efflux regulator RcnB